MSTAGISNVVFRFLILSIIKVAQCDVGSSNVKLAETSSVIEPKPTPVSDVIQTVIGPSASYIGIPQDDTNESSSSSMSSECCENGGVCVLNTFCHCRRNFYGRKCEHKRRTRSCGPIQHGGTFTDGCNYCQCNDGILTCFPSKQNCETNQNAESSQPEVFNLREHKKRHKRKERLRAVKVTTTTIHPLLVEVLKSGGESSIHYKHKSHIMLTCLLSVIFVYRLV